MNFVKYFLFAFIITFSNATAVSYPLVTDGYQLLFSNYSEVAGGKFNCDILPYIPDYSNNQIVQYINSNDSCTIDANGNNDCTDSTSLTSVYSIMFERSYQSLNLIDDSTTRNFDFINQRIADYNSTEISDPLYKDQCVSFSSTISVIPQNPVTQPMCDSVSTNFVSMDLYSTGNHNTGFCTCKNGFLPTSDPLVCSPSSLNFDDSNTFSTVGDIFQSLTQNYNETHTLTSNSGDITTDTTVYKIYLVLSTNAQSCADKKTDLNFTYCNSGAGTCNLDGSVFSSYNTLSSQITDSYYNKGDCYFLKRYNVIKGYQGSILYQSSIDSNTSAGTSTGTGTNTDTGSTTGTSSGTSTDTGTGRGSSTDTGTGTQTNTSSGSSNDLLHQDLLNLTTDINDLKQVNSTGFSDLVSATNDSTDVLKDLRDMNKDDVDSDTNFLNNFTNFSNDIQNSVSNIETNVNDLMATINGDFTVPKMTSSADCSIVFHVFNSQITFNLCRFSNVLRPFIVFILTVTMLILLIRLHLYLFPLVYRLN